MALTFSRTEFKKFRHDNKLLRYGQQFHQYFKLEKITNPEDRVWCNKLYNASNDVAKDMVKERIDHTQ